MSFLGKTINLKGVSHKGKNRIREHGNMWTVLAETTRVLFSSKTGDWLFIAPSASSLGQNDPAARWVLATGDSDFAIVSVEG